MAPEDAPRRVFVRPAGVAHEQQQDKLPGYPLRDGRNPANDGATAHPCGVLAQVQPGSLDRYGHLLSGSERKAEVLLDAYLEAE